ncbi:MAG: hypothetical protein ACKVP3_10955 [Hyphomicrobiaceae bacterium]
MRSLLQRIAYGLEFASDTGVTFIVSDGGKGYIHCRPDGTTSYHAFAHQPLRSRAQRPEAALFERAA